MKIAFFEIQEWEKKYIKRRLFKHDLEFYREPISLELLKKENNFAVISVFIYSKVDKKILQKLPKLKLITTKIGRASCRERV